MTDHLSIDHRVQLLTAAAGIVAQAAGKSTDVINDFANRETMAERSLTFLYKHMVKLALGNEDTPAR